MAKVHFAELTRKHQPVDHSNDWRWELNEERRNEDDEERWKEKKITIKKND